MAISSRIRYGAAAKALLAAVAVLGCAGCMQLETRVKLNEDGSATITERLRFSKRLLDLDADRAEGDLRLSQMLSEAGAKKRMERMGKGIALVKHEVHEAEGGAQESITEYRIPALVDFRYMSPFLAYKDYQENNAIRFTIEPILQNPHNMCVGELRLEVGTEKPGQREYAPEAGQPVPKGPSPREQQAFRDVSPVIRDMLADFRIRLVFESYCTPSYVGFQRSGRNDGSKEVELINFSDANLDRFGGKFLENEEIMLALVQWDLRNKEVVDHVRDWTGNQTLPVYLPWGSQHMWNTKGPQIIVRPSRDLFTKFVAGKTHRFARKVGNDLKYDERTVAFEDVGYPAAPANTKK